MPLRIHGESINLDYNARYGIAARGGHSLEQIEAAKKRLWHDPARASGMSSFLV
jgi:hypothetical protein